MALPERTLCWVEGPPWDRICEPVEEAEQLLRELADEPFLATPEITDRARAIVSKEL